MGDCVFSVHSISVSGWVNKNPAYPLRLTGLKDGGFFHFAANLNTLPFLTLEVGVDKEVLVL